MAFVNLDRCHVFLNKRFIQFCLKIDTFIELKIKSMSISKAITLSFFILFSISIAAQNDTLVIKPSGNQLQGELIKPYTNKWKLTLIDGKGNKTPRGFWTDYGQNIQIDGVEYFHRVQDLYNAASKLTDTWTNMTELKSLRPVSFQRINPNGGYAFYQFNGNKVSVTSNFNKDKQIDTKEIELKEPVFDWNLYGMLLVGLPMKEGRVVKLPFFDTNTNKLSWLIANIEKKETLKLYGKRYRTWKITTNQKLVFWISQEKPYVIQLTLDLGNNSTLLWEAF